MSERAGFSIEVEWDKERSRASAALRHDGAPQQLYEGDGLAAQHG